MANGVDVLSTFQTVGAALAIVTSVLFFGDRLTKGNPVAIIEADRDQPYGAARSTVRIANRSDRPIIVELPGGKTREGHFQVARDDSTHGLVTAATVGETVAVDANGAVRFPLLKPLDYDGIDDTSYLRVVIRWRFAQPIAWHGNRTMTASIRKADYKTLVGGYALDNYGLSQ